jgi:hypothetical protein
MLSEEVYLSRFGKDRLAAMSDEQLEQALAGANQRVIEFKEYEKEVERQFREEGVLIHISSFDRMCQWDVTFYEIELALRKRRALNEDRLTLLKELRNVRREREYDRDAFPDRREIVIEEILNERGGFSLAYRRYSRGVRPSKKLSEKRQAEKLKRRMELWRQGIDKARSETSEEPHRD